MSVIKFLKQILSQGWKDEAPRMSAALSFYMIFSMAPILMLAIALAGLVFGQKLAQDQMIDQLQRVIGQANAEVVQTMVEASVRPFPNILATLVGVITLFIGATGALVELQDGLNRIWKVNAENSVTYLLKQRLLSLALVAGISLLLLASLAVTATLTALGTLISHHLVIPVGLLHTLDFFLSCWVITTLFAMIFKTLPKTVIPWNDVWIGACVTAVLFTAGKFLMGLYLARDAMTSTYGAAGSFVAILAWVYYSALVLYFGAEFTKAYADQYGSRKKFQ